MLKYVSPKRLQLPARQHGAKTQKNIIILTTVKPSNLTISLLFCMDSKLSLSPYAKSMVSGSLRKEDWIQLNIEELYNFYPSP
jgi:hypothetical protein